MAVKIRMKKMGRKHRPFYRICAMDSRSPRDGRALEELGTYDPSVPETDARVTLNGERVDFWIGNGAQPSEKVAVLVKKYGTNGTHLEQQQQALGRLAVKTVVQAVAPPAKPVAEEAPAEAEAAAPSEEVSADAPAAE